MKSDRAPYPHRPIALALVAAALLHVAALSLGQPELDQSISPRTELQARWWPSIERSSAGSSKGIAPEQQYIERWRTSMERFATRHFPARVTGVLAREAPVLRAVATDGHRLARVEEPLPEGAKAMPGVIIPRKTVNEIRKLAEETQDEIVVRLSDTKVQFALGTVTLTSKLIDGTFPEYERVIPRGNDKKLVVPRKDFADAVKRVAAISSERSRPVKLSLGTNHLRVSAASPDQGEAQEDLEGDDVAYTSGALEIGFQARYLSDITDLVQDKLEFMFADGAAPTIVRDASRPEALFVLMPMRV